MKINVINVGDGIKRMEIETSFGEPSRVPTHIADDIMRDVVRRERNGQNVCTCQRIAIPAEPAFAQTTSWNRPLPTPPNREPDGIDVHVDRPQRSMYGGVSWAAEDAFRRDMSKYRSLEALAKQCNWPAREPMKGVGFDPQHMAAQRTQNIPVPAPRMVAPRTCGCGCSREKDAVRAAISALNVLMDTLA